MELIRNYLTTDELTYIVLESLNKNNAIEREILKVGLVSQLLIKDLGEFNSCDEIYDYLLENDSLELLDTVKNYHMIDYFIDKELGTANVVKKFLDELNIKIDEYSKNLDAENMTNLIEQFKQLSEKKEVE